METKDKQQKSNGSKPLALILAIVMLVCLFPVTASASDEKTQVTGQVYEFEKDSHYEFQKDSTSQKSDGANTYGIFSISGNIISVGEKSGVPSYEVFDGNLSFFYNYADTLLNADVDSWHLVDDKSNSPPPCINNDPGRMFKVSDTNSVHKSIKRIHG